MKVINCGSLNYDNFYAVERFVGQAKPSLRTTTTGAAEGRVRTNPSRWHTPGRRYSMPDELVGTDHALCQVTMSSRAEIPTGLGAFQPFSRPTRPKNWRLRVPDGR